MESKVDVEVLSQNVMDLIRDRFDHLEEHLDQKDAQIQSLERDTPRRSEVVESVNQLTRQLNDAVLQIQSLVVAVERLVSQNFMPASDVERRLLTLQNAMDQRLGRLEDRAVGHDKADDYERQHRMALRASRWSWIGILGVIPAIYYLLALLTKMHL